MKGCVEAMKRKKVMRGYLWSIFFFGAVVFIVTSILGLCGVARLGQGSTIANIVSILIAGLYVAAYFLVPKCIKPAAAGPSAPAQNIPLAVPAHLTIVRERSAAGAVVPCIISLNGQQVCSLSNGASATITLSKKHNVLLTNAAGSSKVRYEFDAADGAEGEIHVKSGMFLAKTMHWKETRSI